MIENSPAEKQGLTCERLSNEQQGRWWREKDSNLRRRSRQIYSLIPLATREPLHNLEIFKASFISKKMVEGEGFEPSKAEPSDLQSDPFGHSGTPPHLEIFTASFTTKKMVEGEGFEPSKAEPSDLQSDPFGHSGTPPSWRMYLN